MGQFHKPFGQKQNFQFINRNNASHLSNPRTPNRQETRRRNNMPQFALLLSTPESQYDNLSPEEIQALLAKYVAWREGLVERNIYRGSQKLVDGTGRRLRTQNGKVLITEGPFSESQEVLGGFFVIEVPTYEDAVEVARTCPHLVDGHLTEIRQLDPMTPPPAQL
jgi:hypothetical protein